MVFDGNIHTHFPRKTQCVDFKSFQMQLSYMLNILELDSSVLQVVSFVGYTKLCERYTKIDLDELYRLHYLFFRSEPSIIEKDLIY